VAARLYLDADVDVLLARLLRDEGYDAITAVEANLRTANDEEQLLYAAREGRVLLTYNIRHLAPLHNEWLAQGREHAGIVVSHQYRRQDIGDLVRVVRKLLEVATEDDLRTRLRFLSEFDV